MRTRAQSRPKIAVALGLLMGWTVIAAVGLAFGDPLPEACIDASIWTVFFGIVVVYGLRRTRRVNARLKENGQILAYLRYPDSLPGSLSRIWNMGIATPTSGRIDFQPAVYDTLEPSGRPTQIQVLEVLPGRRPTSREDRKYIGGIGNIQIMSFQTDQGKVEIAASPESLAKLAASPAE